MRRIAALTVLVLAFGAACTSTGSAPAATVNGVKLPTSDLIDELNAINANGDYLATFKTNPHGATPGSFDAAFVAQVLLQQINYSMIHEEFVKRNIQPNDDCRNQAKNELFLQLGSQDANTGEAIFNKFSDKYKKLLEQRNTELFALEYSLAGQNCGVPVDGLGYYNSHPDEFTNVCILAIAVPDEATANNVVSQARGGADFAQLARDISLDEQTKANGGDLGCLLPSRFNQAVAAQLQSANIGDVMEPFPIQNGFGVFKVYDKKPLTPAEAQSSADELATLALTRDFDTWLSASRAAATVTVDSRYGTFDKDKWTIDAPPLAASSSSAPASSSTEAP